MLKQLVANGNVVGTYGSGVDPIKPTTDKGDPNYTTQNNFDLNFQRISGSYPSAATGEYPVRAGDTLQSIAQSAYGDASLWYLIADANGLRGNEDLRVGQNITIPTRVGGTHNSANTHRPYDPSSIIGSTTPNLPAPTQKPGACAIVGLIAVALITVALTVFTAGAVGAALGPVLGAFGAAVLGGAVGGAVGSFFGQGAAVAFGLKDEIDWGEVGLSALGGAVSGGLGFGADKLLGSIGKVSSTLRSIAQPAVRGAEAALSEAATQGMAYLTHQREGWSWRDVASAALTAGGGASVGDVVGQTANWGMDRVFGEAESKGWKVVREVTAKTLSGAASRVTTTLARGGTVEPGYIAADAFGNALGSALGGTGVGYAQEDMARKRLEEQAAAIAAVERQGPERFHLVPPEDLRLKLDLDVGGLRNYSMAARAAVDGEIGVPGNGEGQVEQAVAGGAGETPSANGAKPAGGLLSTAASMLDEMALSAVQAQDAARKQQSAGLGQAACLGNPEQCQKMYDQVRRLKELVPTLQENIVISNGRDTVYITSGNDYSRGLQAVDPSQISLQLVVDLGMEGNSRAADDASFATAISNKELERLAAVFDGLNRPLGGMPGTPEAEAFAKGALEGLSMQNPTQADGLLDPGVLSRNQTLLGFSDGQIDSFEGLISSRNDFLRRQYMAGYVIALTTIGASTGISSAASADAAIDADVAMMLRSNELSNAQANSRLATGVTDAQRAARADVVRMLELRQRQLALGTDPVRGYIESEGIGGPRIEQALGRQISRSTDPAADFVDRTMGPISLKGPIPSNGSAEGLGRAAIDDALHNSYTKALFVDLKGLPRVEAEAVKAAVRAKTTGATKSIFFLE